MTASATNLLPALLSSLLVTRTTADALFALAASVEANDPDEAKIFRSIARDHRVRVLQLEAQIVALSGSPVRTASDRPSRA